MSAKRLELLRLLEKMGIPISKAYVEAIAKIVSRAQIRQLIVLLETSAGFLTTAAGFGDIGSALTSAGMRAGSWTLVTEAVRNVYLTGGIFTMDKSVPARFGAEFNINNIRADTWLRTHSSELITFITNEQMETIRITLQAGFQAGRNPRSVALDIVGRISRKTGRRTGGIIGLNVPQTNAVANARAELGSLDSNYFTRVRRDRRFDSTVRKAIAAKIPLPKATVDRLVGRYSDSLLKLRGDTIGRTEALKALNASSDEALRQVIDDGLVPANAVKRIWRHSFSPGERPGHLQMSGQERGVEDAFLNPVTGITLQHPGAGPASEIINCRCMVEHKIDFVAVELVS